MDKKGNKSEHIIKEVYPDSIAEEMEIEPGMCFLQLTILRYRMSLTIDI